MITRKEWEYALDRLMSKLYFVHAYSTGHPFEVYAIEKQDYGDQLIALGGVYAHFLPVAQYMSELGLTDYGISLLKEKYDVLPGWLKEDIYRIVERMDEFDFLDSDDAARLAELITMAYENY